MPTSPSPRLGDSRRPTPTRPSRKPGDRTRPPRVRNHRSPLLRLLGRLCPAQRSDSDSGAAFTEIAAVTILVGMILLAVYQSQVAQIFNNAVREMVCLVEGPECGGETWTEVERPPEPEAYEWNALNSNTADNQGIGMAIAHGYGWSDQEWNCLDDLWTSTSNWDHTLVDPDTGAVGIVGFVAADHGEMPAGFAGSARTQIHWGIDYIDQTYGSPCGAWSQWQATHTY